MRHRGSLPPVPQRDLSPLKLLRFPQDEPSAHRLQFYGSMETIKRFFGDESGQSATEYMLIVSVVVIAVVAGAYSFVPTFQQGVSDLARDVSTILDGGCINGCAGGMARK